MTLFDNCLIQAPDGINLSRCGLKKVRWYVENNLADVVCDSPITIRLRFEPSGRRGLDDPLLMDGKPNLCVVCGTTEDLTRHHIIPYCFIKHMQVEYKVDVIRDIFPLCRCCHNEYEKKSQEKRKEMADRFGIPLYGINPEELRRVRQITGAAAALLRHNEKIPPARRDELLVLIGDFLGTKEVTEQDLKNLLRYKITQRNDYVSFSKYIAQNTADYSEFAREWRTHFVESMQPKHMPSAWHVDRKTDNVWVPTRMLNQQARQLDALQSPVLDSKK